MDLIRIHFTLGYLRRKFYLQVEFFSDMEIEMSGYLGKGKRRRRDENCASSLKKQEATLGLFGHFFFFKNKEIHFSTQFLLQFSIVNFPSVLVK